MKYHQIVTLLLLIAFSIFALAVDAENQAPEPTQSETPAEETVETPSQADSVVADTQPEAETPPPASAPTARTIKPFTPTEQIDADSAVTFPIDI